MKIVIAPDSFKGSLSAFDVCRIVSKAARQVYQKPEIVEIPMADGGRRRLSASARLQGAARFPAGSGIPWAGRQKHVILFCLMDLQLWKWLRHLASPW